MLQNIDLFSGPPVTQLPAQDFLQSSLLFFHVLNLFLLHSSTFQRVWFLLLCVSSSFSLILALVENYGVFFFAYSKRVTVRF